MTFRRSPLSGGWDPKAQTGDIFPLEMKDTFPLIIEARKNAKLTLDKILLNNNIIDIWFKEKKSLYEGHAKEHRLVKKPIIFIMSRNNFEPIVVMETSWLKYPIVHKAWPITPHIQVNTGNYSKYTIFLLSKFLLDLNHESILDGSLYGILKDESQATTDS